MYDMSHKMAVKKLATCGADIWARPGHDRSGGVRRSRTVDDGTRVDADDRCGRIRLSCHDDGLHVHGRRVEDID